MVEKYARPLRDIFTLKNGREKNCINKYTSLKFAQSYERGGKKMREKYTKSETRTHRAPVLLVEKIYYKSTKKFHKCRARERAAFEISGPAI